MFPVIEQIKNVSQTLSTNVYLLAHLKCHLNDRKGIKQFKSIKVNRGRDIRQGNRWISGEWFSKEMINSAVVEANRRQTSDGLSNWQHRFLQNQGLEVIWKWSWLKTFKTGIGGWGDGSHAMDYQPPNPHITKWISKWNTYEQHYDTGDGVSLNPKI